MTNSMDNLQASNNLTEHAWREQLNELEGKLLLPIGAGKSGKAPIDPLTGRPLSGWEKKSYSAKEIKEMNDRVTGAGIRLGRESDGLVCFDFDGQSSIDRARDHECDPFLAETWRIVRKSAPGRLKIVFRVPQQQWDDEVFKQKRSIKTGDGEAIEIFFDTQQIVVLGLHKDSGDQYEWDRTTPKEIADLPANWLELANHIMSNKMETNKIKKDKFLRL